MGFLSKASKFAFGSSGAKYNINDAMKTGNIGVLSDLGNVGIQKQPDGTWAKVYTSSAADQQRNKLINQGLGGLSLNPQDAQQAYYEQATRLLQPQMQRQTDTTDERLINRGIQTGTEQYQRVMKDLQDQQAGTLSDISNQAVFQGQNLLGQQIGNINSLAAGRDISQLSGMGGTSDAYDSSYQGKMYNDQMRANRNQNIMGTLGSLGGGSLSKFSKFSDKRVKENLKKVGKLDNGLKVYSGNYKKETGLDTRPQLFLLAQEVRKKKPQAVGRRLGILTVNYGEAVK